MSIDELKKQRVAIAMGLHNAVRPLQERLSQFGFVIWWSGLEYNINTSACGDESFDQVFPLHDAQLGYLMSMPDTELLEYCQNWESS